MTTATDLRKNLQAEINAAISDQNNQDWDEQTDD